MSDTNAGLDPDFVERQRGRLLELQRELEQLATGTQSEETDLQAQYAEEVQDSGDEAANEARREVDEVLNAGSNERLAKVRRALEKVEEGTYGQSDLSDEPIPQARLDAVPEACMTVAEESSRERT